MAPHLYGAHVTLDCEACGFQATMRGDRPIENPLCPNCGAANSPGRLKRHPAPVVKVRELDQAPERWKVYAFFVQHAAAAKRVTVKRLVGMPGEELTISEGDLWVDGSRVVKNWNQQRQLAVMVRDFQFLPPGPSGTPLPPWETIGQPDDWSITASEIRHQPTGSTGQFARLEYVNWAGYHTGQSRFEPTPVMDAQPFDPLEAGSLTPVADLLLEAELDSVDADFRLEWRLFSEPLSIEFRASEQTLRIRAGEETVHESHWIPPPRGSVIGCSTFDRSVTVAINEKPLVQVPIRLTPTTDRDRLSRPLALEGGKGKLILKGMKLYRDVYYCDRSETKGTEGGGKRYRLGADEYFFLGDNPAESIDSRDWTSPGLNLKQIIGSVSGQTPK